METVKEMVRNIVVIVMVTTFLDMILPSGALRSYVKVVMGLFILVALLSPVMNLFEASRGFAAFSWQHEESESGLVPFPGTNGELGEVNQDMFLQSYANRAEVQMKALVLLVPGVENADVSVALEGGERLGTIKAIREVTVFVNGEKDVSSVKEVKEVSPVRIELGPGSEDDGIQNGREQGGKKGGALSGGRETASPDSKKIEEEIRSTLCQYFGLKPQQVVIVF